MAKPMFLYVLGVEGCGHHALTPVLFQASGARPEDRAGLRRLFDERWINPANENPAARLRLDRAILQEADRLIGRGVRLVIEDNSFPSGHHPRRRDPTAHWALIEMRDLLSSRFEMRYLALHRDPIEATFSHRQWDGGLVGHARTVALYYRVLEAFLRRLDPAEFRVLDYRDLLFRQEATARGLAEFLGLDLAAVRAAAAAHLDVDPRRVERWKTKLGPEERVWITRFFALHAPAWPTFRDARFSLVREERCGAA